MKSRFEGFKSSCVSHVTMNHSKNGHGKEGGADCKGRASCKEAQQCCFRYRHQEVVSVHEKVSYKILLIHGDECLAFSCPKLSPSSLESADTSSSSSPPPLHREDLPPHATCLLFWDHKVDRDPSFPHNLKSRKTASPFLHCCYSRCPSRKRGPSSCLPLPLTTKQHFQQFHNLQLRAALSNLL
jgi:hypothetical protein